MSRGSHAETLVRRLARAARRLLPRALAERLIRTATYQRYYYRRWLAGFDPAQEPELAVVRLLVAPGSTAVDVGANLGVYTRFLSEYVGPRGKVYALEPVPSTFELLAHNVRALRLANVELVRCAASDRSGTASIEIPLDAAGRPDLYLPRIVDPMSAPRGRRVAVECRTLDSIVREAAFVKVDVEGHELACVRGASDLLARCRPAWLVEITDDPAQAGSSAAALFTVMEDAGYQPYALAGGALRPGFRRANDGVNCFFLRQEHLPAVGSVLRPC